MTNLHSFTTSQLINELKTRKEELNKYKCNDCLFDTDTTGIRYCTCFNQCINFDQFKPKDQPNKCATCKHDNKNTKDNIPWCYVSRKCINFSAYEPDLRTRCKWYNTYCLRNTSLICTHTCCSFVEDKPKLMPCMHYKTISSIFMHCCHVHNYSCSFASLENPWERAKECCKHYIASVPCKHILTDGKCNVTHGFDCTCTYTPSKWAHGKVFCKHYAEATP